MAFRGRRAEWMPTPFEVSVRISAPLPVALIDRHWEESLMSSTDNPDVAAARAELDAVRAE
ncbi:MAG: hypothetical protein JHD12_03915, partial [Rhodococcus sp.]|nr:hypothetical protein [Rhodococcus sp. (in: high G+C Gram-positive bacteria)]